MTLTRSDIARVARLAGWVQGTKYRNHAGSVRTAIKIAVRDAILADPDALKDAPRIWYDDKGANKMRQMNIRDAADSMIEELDVMVD
jgi:hypothetical protein